MDYERTHSGPISDDVGKSRKKRISYDEADCSMRNIRKQGKVSRLHGPTLHALLTLIQIWKEKDSGAAGIQRGRDAINYFCMEYPGNQESM